MLENYLRTPIAEETLSQPKLNFHVYSIYRLPMASTVSTGSISDEEKRWIVVGICLTKVLTPLLRNTVATELQKWYNALCQPPNEIDKQVLRNYNKKLPPSKKLLQYKNINSNHVHSNPKAYDYTVRDPLSLAKLFLLPFMARFTGFDQTMDLSAVLAVMCEADPFVKTGGAVHAENVRSKIRNEWAHCNFSSWTKPMFNAAIQDMQCLVKTVNLSPAVEKEMCDHLDDWKNKGIKIHYSRSIVCLKFRLGAPKF